MLTIHVWPRRLKEFLLTHPLYKSPKIPGTRVAVAPQRFVLKAAGPAAQSSFVSAL
jgi:hypothetical protein